MPSLARIALATSILLTTPALGQTTHVVTNEAEFELAAQTSVAGDVILLDALVLDFPMFSDALRWTKGVTIASSSVLGFTQIRYGGQFEVRDLPPDQVFVLRDVVLECDDECSSPRMSIEDNEGPVLISDCILLGGEGTAGAYVLSSDRTVFSRCSLSGGSKDFFPTGNYGLLAFDTRVAVESSTVVGYASSDPTEWSQAVWLQGSDLVASSSTFAGGSACNGTGGLPAVVGLSGSNAVLRGCSFAYSCEDGITSFGLAPAIGGFSGPSGGDVVMDNDPASFWVSDATLTPGETGSWNVSLEFGHVPVLGLSLTQPVPTPLVPDYDLWLTGPLAAVQVLGSVSGSPATISQDFVAPPVPLGGVLRVWAQGASVDPVTGELLLLAPGMVLVHG